MSHQSPQSSANACLSSSPFASTDPTLYSPEIVRNPRSGHRRDNVSQVTVVTASNLPMRKIDKPSDRQKSTLINPVPYVQGAFVNEMSEDDKTYISRYQFISQLPDGTNAGLDSEHELFSVQHQMKLYACFSNCVPVYARGVHLRYDDLHDAAEAKDILEQHDFTVDYVSGYDFALAKSQDTAQLNEFEGQIKLSVMIEPNPDHAIWEFVLKDLAGVLKSVEATAGVFGAIRNCIHVDTVDAKMLLVFRIEYHSVDAANRAVQSLGADLVWGVSNEKTFRWCTVDPSHWVSERALNSPHRTKPRIDDQGRLFGFRPAPNNYPGPSFFRHPHDQHNRVRRDRILDGSDVRTTIMLRNIPNKMDWMSLKAILDDVCFGTYDFVYLRIDFKSGCNVGYAFINFSDVHGMIDLIDRIERRCWIGFRSAKAAEISYATIQGREALIQKFRNSSVMQETPFCRPRLFFTFADAEIMGQLRNTGTEQAFPRPDNLSKLQRSMDSARSIGLYPPHGYSSITEHRNRTSAYDRGTPRDIMQAAMQFARQRAAPVPFTTLSDTKKREIEVWYSSTYGRGQLGYIPFDFIPMTHVAQYFSEVQSAPAQVPGVIGGPVNTSYIEPARISNTTPTRGPRTMTRTPAPARSVRVAVDHISNPFM
ncbi:RNA recognition motif 2-domain-containing protein [Pyrenochaeta sp. MPI-SDFR-AT-0127]|nr:RNA recognition motif 2-domain-containing protein [Pyrenochaeta sp. MPI-SDFR-AT-0127]